MQMLFLTSVRGATFFTSPRGHPIHGWGGGVMLPEETAPNIDSGGWAGGWVGRRRGRQGLSGSQYPVVRCPLGPAGSLCPPTERPSTRSPPALEAAAAWIGVLTARSAARSDVPRGCIWHSLGPSRSCGSACPAPPSRVLNPREGRGPAMGTRPGSLSLAASRRPARHLQGGTPRPGPEGGPQVGVALSALAAALRLRSEPVRPLRVLLQKHELSVALSALRGLPAAGLGTACLRPHLQCHLRRPRLSRQHAGRGPLGCGVWGVW